MNAEEKHPQIFIHTELLNINMKESDSYLPQAKKILEETKIKTKYKDQLTSWMEEFQLFLNTLPIHIAINISSFSKRALGRPSRDLRFVKNIANHSKNNLCCDEDITINFIRPECVGTFGLFKIDALPGPNIEMNLHMTIPKKCFQIRDSLNNRYFIKKFFYLMYLAEHLKSINICSSIKCAYYNENVLLPYLILCPNINKKITVKIFLVPEQNYFKATKYSPDVSNINAQVFEHDLGNIDNIGKLPSTFYNASLGFDATLAENNVFIEQLFSTSISFQEGLKLIVIWMKQRKISNGLGTFTTDMAIYFMVYLILKQKINKNMSNYQVFRTFLYFIHRIDLAQTPISICEDISKEEIQKNKLFSDIVLIDKTGTYNTTTFLNMNAYLKMKHECELALDILDRSLCSFSELVFTNIPIYLQYDAIIDLKSDNNYESLLRSVEPKEKAKYAGNHMLLIMKILLEHLKRGFNKRVTNIVPIVTYNAEWEYGFRHKISNCRILFGLQLNKNFAYNILEYDPILNGTEGFNFKEFWNDLAGITWFQDDSVAFQFKADNIKDKRDIIRTMANYLLTKKLHLKHKLYYNELENFLLNGKTPTSYSLGTNEETSQRIIDQSEYLTQKIKSLDMKPEIIDINGVSDVFCYTSVFPPVPNSFVCNEKMITFKGHNMILKDTVLSAPLKYVEPVECVLQLESESEFPDDLKILQEYKTIYLVKISELLGRKYNIISSVKPPHLDVLSGGIIFRYNMFFSKEIDLMKILLESSELTNLKQHESILEFEKRIFVVPKIIAALKGINTLHPSYGVSTCLAKRWIRSQLIDDFLLPDMVINLLNAHQYLHKWILEPALAPQQAFLRFLKFIVEVKWGDEPVVVNFNNELKADKISEMKKAMKGNRKGFPALVILTPYDDGNSVFTKFAPCEEVLVRLKILATEFLKYVKNIILDESLFSWKELFIPNKRGYNCILNLEYFPNARMHEQITGTISREICSKPTEEDRYLPLINFNPVQSYLSELRANYGQYCVFFHDTYGGKFIGVLWLPGIQECKEDIRRGFEILGKGVLKSIDVKSE